MSRVFGYVRVSTHDQADSGLGLAAQRKAIRDEYDRRWANTYEWGGIYEDAATSGKVEFRSREAGLRLSNTAEKGDIIVFSKLDRAFRSTIDTLTTVEVWRARGVSAVFLDFNIDTATPAGEFMLTIMAAGARMERRRIGERTREAFDAMRAKGTMWKRPPTTIKIRWTDAGRAIWEVNPVTFKLGQLIVKWRSQGHSFEAIRVHLRDNEIVLPPRKFKNLHVNKYLSLDRIMRLHKATINTMGWLADGSARWPKGHQPTEAMESAKEEAAT